MNIYVGNLPFQFTEEDLKSAFAAYGQVESVKIIQDMYTGRSRGFGFVEMLSGDEAQAAIDGLNGKEFEGRALNVNKARSRSETRGGGRRRSGKSFY